MGSSTKTDASSESGLLGSRRRSPRLLVAGALHIRFLNASHQAILRDLSGEGFALFTNEPVPVGKRCYFAIGPDEQRTRLMSAQAMYCTARGHVGGGYLSGWAADDNEVTKGALQAAVEHLTARLIFDVQE